ncbi:MAG: MFS transporter [Anaerolineae bacterium]
MTAVGSALSTLSHSFSPLRERNFAIYLSGQMVSLIGSWLQVTAQSWVVWQLTGSEAALGTVTMLQYLPLLLLSPWAGVWTDRLDRRKLLIGTQVTLMALAFLTAVLVQTNAIQVWQIYVLAIIVGIVNTLDLPAQQAFLGDLVGMGEVRKAVNLNAMIIQVSRMLGPAVAGILVARVGMAPSFWLNGLSFVVVIVSLMLVRANQKRSQGSRESVPKQLKAAWAYLRTEPRLQDMYIFSGMLTFLILSIMFSLLPAYADHVLSGGADMLGALMSASGAGALVSVIFIVPLAQARRHPGKVLAIALPWSAIWMIVFGLSHSAVLSLFAIFMVSIGNPITFTMALGLIQLMSPQDMRGRMLSLNTMVSFGLQPIAALVVGNLAENLGVGVAVLINSLVMLVGVVGLFWFRRGLRQWEVNPQTIGTPSEPPPIPAAEV